MSEPVRPQAKSRAKREQMADAAARLLIDEGPAAVTHRRVAEAAGLPPGSGNFYFKTKAELYRAAVHGAEDLRARSALEAARAGGRTWATLDDVARDLLAVFFAPRIDADVVVRRLTPILDAGRDPDLHETMKEHEPLLAEALNIVIERAAGSRLGEKDMVMLMQTMGASLLYGAARGEPDPVDYAVHSVARLLELFGLRAGS